MSTVHLFPPHPTPHQEKVQQSQEEESGVKKLMKIEDVVSAQKAFVNWTKTSAQHERRGFMTPVKPVGGSPCSPPSLARSLRGKCRSLSANESPRSSVNGGSSPRPSIGRLRSLVIRNQEEGGKRSSNPLVSPALILTNEDEPGSTQVEPPE